MAYKHLDTFIEQREVIEFQWSIILHETPKITHTCHPSTNHHTEYQPSTNDHNVYGHMEHTHTHNYNKSISTLILLVTNQ